MARVQTNLLIIDSNNPRMRVNVGQERRWLFGPTEGRWWRHFAWWVIPLGAVLLTVPWYLYFTAPTPAPRPSAPVTAPRTPAGKKVTHQATVPQPVAAAAQSPTAVDLTPVGQGLEAVADAVSRLRTTPYRPQPLNEYGEPVVRTTNPCAGLAPTEERRCRIWNQQ